MHEGSAVAEATADPVAQKLKRRIGGYAKNGNRQAADELRHELDFHQLKQHATRVAPQLTAEERARIREIVESAPDLSDEDAARIRNALPSVAAEAVSARAS